MYTHYNRRNCGNSNTLFTYRPFYHTFYTIQIQVLWLKLSDAAGGQSAAHEIVPYHYLYGKKLSICIISSRHLYISNKNFALLLFWFHFLITLRMTFRYTLWMINVYRSRNISHRYEELFFVCVLIIISFYLERWNSGFVSHFSARKRNKSP